MRTENDSKNIKYIALAVVLTFVITATGFATYIGITSDMAKKDIEASNKELASLKEQLTQVQGDIEEVKVTPTKTPVILTPIPTSATVVTPTKSSNPTVTPITQKTFSDNKSGIKFTYPSNMTLTETNFNAQADILKTIRINKSANSYLIIEYTDAGFGCLQTPEQLGAPFDKVDAVIPSITKGNIARLQGATLSGHNGAVYTDYTSSSKNNGYIGMCGQPILGLFKQEVRHPGYLNVVLVSNNLNADYAEFDTIVSSLERIMVIE